MKPLTGLKVLDFSALLPGPWATSQLAGMGADVIRVESPNHPDMLRAFPNAFTQINGCKSTWVLNLKEPQSIESIKAQLNEIDIIVEQFRPGVMRRLGLHFDDLASEFPHLIYCSLTGYGQTGPLCERAGHDINYQALAGLASYSGSAQPATTSVQVGDIAGGSYPAMVGILAAVIERYQTGKGQYLDVAMADGALALNTMTAPEVLAGNNSPAPQQEMLNGGTFYDYYLCADDTYLSFGGLEPKFYTLFCKAVGKEGWIHRFADFSSESQSQLKKDLSTLFQSETRNHWLETLHDDCCVEPVLNLAEALEHPQFAARGLIEENEDGQKILKPPVQFHAIQK